MIKSMTGYGRSSAEFGSKKITAEIKSLNSKGLDASVKSSSLYREREAEIRSMVSEKLVRGKIDLAIFSESTEEEKRTEINVILGKQYYEQLKTLADAIGTEPADYFSLILRMPDIFNSEKPELTDEEWAVAQKVMSDAIHQLDEFRNQEGSYLEKDLRQRIDSIEQLQHKIAEHAGDRAVRVREKLAEALKQISDRELADENRFEQELIYYLEKLDITEELVRLKGHCSYFVETLNEAPGQGKKLGFICQEIGREINTIGSKANHTEIQRFVVEMKDELEKIKEQILNIM